MENGSRRDLVEIFGDFESKSRKKHRSEISLEPILTYKDFSIFKNRETRSDRKYLGSKIFRDSSADRDSDCSFSNCDLDRTWRTLTVFK